MCSGNFLAKLQKHQMMNRPGEVKSRLPLAGLGTDDLGTLRAVRPGSATCCLPHLAPCAPLFFFFKSRYNWRVTSGKFQVNCRFD